MNKAVNCETFIKTCLVVVAIFLLTFARILSASADHQQINMSTKDTLLDSERIIDKASCRLRDDQFDVVLASPSGDNFEDDTTLWFVKSGQIVKANPHNPGYISFLPAIPKLTSTCDGVASFTLSKGHVIIPLFLSGRPSLDYLSVAVYDSRNNNVLTYEVLESYYGEEPNIVAIKNGFSYLAVSSRPNGGPEGLEESWLNITWDGKHLVRKWDNSRSKILH